MASSRRSGPRASVSAVYSGCSKETWDVGLCAEVVDLVGLDLLDDVDERGCVGQVAVVQDEVG